MSKNFEPKFAAQLTAAHGAIRWVEFGLASSPRWDLRDTQRGADFCPVTNCDFGNDAPLLCQA